MILNTGQRTDIPSFYSEWFFNRLKEGFVYVRNPYFPKIIKKFYLNKDVIDLIVFCTKNPHKILENIKELDGFRQFWFVTITPYGKDLEKNNINKKEVIEEFKKLSIINGKESVSVRYDPIILTEKYNKDFHLKAFDKLLILLEGYTNYVVISFVDLYKGTTKRLPNIKSLTVEDKYWFVNQFSQISKRHNMYLNICGEDIIFEGENVLNGKCIDRKIIEECLGNKITLVRPKTNTRPSCFCFLGNDIGQYDTCLNGCEYCYATSSFENALKNYKNHDPKSPILVGHLEKDDIIKEAEQISIIDRQINLF